MDVGRLIGRWPVARSFRVRLDGKSRFPRTGPVVLVANHSSMVDGPVLFGVLPRRVVFLIKQEMFRGIAGRGLRRIGQLAVRRGVPDRAPLLAAQKVLRGGGVVGVFPEGTRGSGDVAQAQQGAAWLARSTGAVVVPVACRGTRRPEGSGRRFRPVVDVLVGEPFELNADKGRLGLEKATEQVRDRLAMLVAELDSKRSVSGEAG
ncbi:lysophospholipid acyltransferase family protein [Actinosynnema sp. NPDC047251]|nr:lysophospholipid acyltransferase family protein [Saccharothrix espanaensis]